MKRISKAVPRYDNNYRNTNDTRNSTRFQRQNSNHLYIVT